MTESTGLSDQATMVANRLAKNAKRMSRWLRVNNIQAYRLYDAELSIYPQRI